MKTPAGLQPLLDDGVIDAVIRPLKSGKEASVYVVSSGTQTLCAKVYKDMRQRSFQARVQYEEGRGMRGSRHRRAVLKGSKFGRREQEDAWKNAEVDALYQLHSAGVCVPEPKGYSHGVLLMALVSDADGEPAPRLGEVTLSAQIAREYHQRLVRDVARMLCADLIHGDLSEYNILVDVNGPVIIDLPQVVNAAGNQAARALLLRDVHNIRASCARFAPELMDTYFGEEMWALYAVGELQADTPLTGEFTFDEASADVDQIRWAIEDARQVALIREQGRADAEES